MAKSLFTFAFLAAASLIVGCEKPPEIGQVTGKITMDGEPMGMIRVLCMPDPNSGNSGPHSECISAEDGTYDLLYSKEIDVHGAVTGWHIITLEDIAGEESRTEYIPIRIPAKYGSAATSPLRIEVKPGAQTFPIEIEK